MKITLNSVKSRLRMIANIDTAAIACELEEDGKTINIKKDVFIVFSVSSSPHFLEKEKQEILNKYEGIARTWKEAIFGKSSNVKVWVIDACIHKDFGKFKKINLHLEPDMIITKKDLAERFRDIGGIIGAWIICEAGNSEEYINYRYDMGIYAKLDEGVDEGHMYSRIRESLFLLFGGEGTIFELRFLENDETNIRYKWLDLSLEDMTKIL